MPQMTRVPRSVSIWANRLTRRLGPYAPIPRSRVRVLVGDEHNNRIGSDVRQKQPVWGRCYLCRRNARLLLSHVTPRWATDHMKREAASGTIRGNRHAALRIEPAGIASSSSQDSSKHYMLCEPCEQYVSAGERVWATLCNGSEKDVRNAGFELDAIDAVTWSLGGNARALLLRALLATSLKIHYSPSHLGRMPERQLKAVRAYVLRDDYSELAPAIAVRWLSFSHVGDEILPNPRACVLTDISKPGNLQVMAGGTTWFVALAEADPEIVSFMRDNPWTIASYDVNNNLLWEQMAGRGDKFGSDEEATDIGVKISRWSPDLPCPCGHGENLGSCCARFWLRRAAKRT